MSSVKKFKSLRIDELPIKSLQLDENSRVQLELAEVIDPYEFYVYSSMDDHEAYAHLDQRLNEYYASRERRLRTYSEAVQYSFVDEQAVCVCKSESNGRFYRAQIKFFKQCEKTVSTSYGDKRTTLRIVTFIDYGIMDHTTITNLFPIAEEFASMAPYCIPCRLDFVEPINEYVDGVWSDVAIEFFKHELRKCHTNIVATMFHFQEPLSYVKAFFDQPLSLIIFINENNQQVKLNFYYYYYY